MRFCLVPLVGIRGQNLYSFVRVQNSTYPLTDDLRSREVFLFCIPFQACICFLINANFDVNIFGVIGFWSAHSRTHYLTSLFVFR